MISAPVIIQVEIKGDAAVSASVRELRNALASRLPMHSVMAKDAQKFTSEYLGGLGRHKTAMRLGATPSGHHSKVKIEADASEDAAILRIPTSSGLGRAFHPLVISPGAGRKFLTIPAAAGTYGKSARDFAPGVLKGGTIDGRRGLVYAAGGAPAYFLVRKVSQRQDRTLLPSDAAISDVAAKSAVAYLTNLVNSQPAALT